MDLKLETRQNSNSNWEEKRDGSNSNGSKSCSDCNTTRTPLWRGGPDGPKSLCNACGIKYNKKRRERMGMGVESGKKCRKKKGSSELREILKMRLMSFGSEVVVQISKKVMSKLREEEQAALLLMALSCGSSY